MDTNGLYKFSLLIWLVCYSFPTFAQKIPYVHTVYSRAQSEGTTTYKHYFFVMLMDRSQWKLFQHETTDYGENISFNYINAPDAIRLGVRFRHATLGKMDSSIQQEGLRNYLSYLLDIDKKSCVRTQADAYQFEIENSAPLSISYSWVCSETGASGRERLLASERGFYAIRYAVKAKNVPYKIIKEADDILKSAITYGF